MLMYGPEMNKGLDIFIGMMPGIPSNKYQNIGLGIKEIVDRLNQ
jgi:hypothetical protein